MVGISMAAEFVVMEAGISGGISTSSTEANEKDSFSDIVAPERMTKDFKIWMILWRKVARLY